MPEPKKYRILIVDDHQIVRAGLRALLEQATELTVCGEAVNARQAVASVKKLHPDLTIVDISLRDRVDGIELTRRLHERWPGMPVLVYTLHDEKSFCDAALDAGAAGFCVKSELNLVNAVRQLLQGESFVSPLAPQKR